MKTIRTAEDVYPALDEVAKDLRTLGLSKLAAIIHHRLHEVSWTTRSELFEELQIILNEAFASKQYSLPDNVRDRMKQIIIVIETFLRDS